MPGMPQGRDINEAAAKSVTLVTIADDRSIQIEERVTSIAQFERVSIDATSIDDWRDLVGALGGAIERARDGLASGHLVAQFGGPRAPDGDDAACMAHPARSRSPQERSGQPSLHRRGLLGREAGS